MSDQKLLNTLRDLIGEPARDGLAKAEPRGARPGARVSVPYQESSRGVGGLVSPIEEVSRTYHAPRVVFSSDGLFAFTRLPTHELVMRDAEGTEETRVFSDAP
ncbi:hypothetical protein [Ectopseudomonas hydrolytica]|uniref:hypothetical protein n=1 Tax=Ectopseudomonas hydrolytica TaxID=2493633 RepID=UPI00376EAC3F